MTKKLTWFESHIGTMDDAIELINRFHWHLSIYESNHQWVVTTGEVLEEADVILCATSYEDVQTFIYGMALAYVGLPEPEFEQLVSSVDTWYKAL